MQQNYPWWRRLLARLLILWGQSVSYWGTTLMSERLYNWAVGAYGYALLAQPDSALAYMRRGMLRGRELSDFTGAVRDLSRAIELQPGWPEPYLHRGLLYRFHGAATADRALQDLRRYLEIGPADSWRADVEKQIASLEHELSERRRSMEGRDS